MAVCGLLVSSKGLARFVLTVVLVFAVRQENNSLMYTPKSDFYTKSFGGSSIRICLRFRLQYLNILQIQTLYCAKREAQLSTRSKLLFTSQLEKPSVFRFSAIITLILMKATKNLEFVITMACNKYWKMTLFKNTELSPQNWVLGCESVFVSRFHYAL